MNRPDDTTRPAVVLVHGAWAGPWIWDDIAARLRATGLKVVAPDHLGPEGTPMAEESFEKTVARVVEAVDTCGGPVMVVGHSGGGLLAAAAAEARPDEVRTVVYVAGFMLPSGVLYSDVLSQFLAEMPNEAARLTGIGSHLVFTPERDATSAPVESAMKVFFHDCPPAEARAVAERLRVYPESVRAAAPVLTPKRFGRARRVYIECTDDRAILLAMQRRLQDMSPGARRISLDCGHAPQLAAPDELTAALMTALDDTATAAPAASAAP